MRALDARDVGDIRECRDRADDLAVFSEDRCGGAVDDDHPLGTAHLHVHDADVLAAKRAHRRQFVERIRRARAGDVRTKIFRTVLRRRAGRNVAAEELARGGVRVDLTAGGVDHENSDRHRVEERERGWVRWKSADEFHELHGLTGPGVVAFYSLPLIRRFAAPSPRPAGRRIFNEIPLLLAGEGGAKRRVRAACANVHTPHRGGNFR